MDSVDEDVSARVLLRRVLHTELPRSPVTRSTTSVRRSMRLKNTPGLESPAVALRQRQKQKLHETAQSPLPPPKRQRSLGGNRNPPAAATPSLFDDDITTRGLLRGIIQMDTETSLLISGQPARPDAEPNPESSVSSAGERSEGLSGAELSDLTLHTEPLTHVVRGLSRKKQQRAFSVSAFEKQLEQQPDQSVEVPVAQEKSDVFQDSDLSSGSKSGLNLTLKTPFVDKRTEKAGLQRKVSNRRLPSVEAFDEAVQRCLEQAPEQDSSHIQVGKTLEDSSWQKFTLGLNDVTELYIQPAGFTVSMKKDDTAIQEAEMERDESNKEHDPEENKLQLFDYIDEIHDVPESEDPDVESASQDEDEIVPSSQEAGDDVSLSPEDEIMLAPTQAMTESYTESQDEERHKPEDHKKENVQEDMDTSQGLERITRRAHRSEGGGAVLGIPAGQRITKSFGSGLNPREKDLLEFVNRSREESQNVPDEEMEPHGSRLSHPINITSDINTEQKSQRHHDGLGEEDPEGAEVSTSDRRSQHATNLSGEDLPEIEDTTPEERLPHDTGMTEKDVPDTEEDDLQEEEEEENQSVGEDVMDFEQANQSAEPHSPTPSELEENQSEDEDVVEYDPAIQSAEANSPAQSEPEEEGEEEDDDEDVRSTELSMKTPAFVKQRRVIASTSAQASPTVLKELNSGPTPQVAKRRLRKKRDTSSDVLPKSYVMSVFKHFAKTKVASDVYPVINEILEKYYERLADDLEVYSSHGKRKTIEIEDFELLMRRQGFVTDSTPVNILIEKYLPLEYRKLLIPVATSGNKVIPNKRR